MPDFTHLYSDVKRCGSKPLAVYHMSTNCESATVVVANDKALKQALVRA